MATWRYEISLLVLKKYFTCSLRSLLKYFSTLKEKFGISVRPCNILYVSTICSNNVLVGRFLYHIIIRRVGLQVVVLNNNFIMLLTKSIKLQFRKENNSDSVNTFQVDPLVSLMMVEKVPDSTYEMVGGLDKQIKEIKEVCCNGTLGHAKAFFCELAGEPHTNLWVSFSSLGVLFLYTRRHYSLDFCVRMTWNGQQYLYNSI